MTCPNCAKEIGDDQMLCPHCGSEIRLIPDFDPEIENRIKDTLSEIELPEELTLMENQPEEDTGDIPRAVPDTAEIPSDWDEDWQEEDHFDRTDDEAYEDKTVEEEFDKEYDGDFLDELDDFEDDEDVVKQIALAIHESRFRWVYYLLLFMILGGIGAAVYYFSNQYYQKNSGSYQAEQAAIAASAGDYSTAIEHMEKALLMDSDNMSMKYTLIDYYFANSEDEKGLLMLWEIIYSKGSDSSNAYRRVIDYYESKQNYAMIEEILSNCNDSEILAQFSAYLANPPEFSVEGGTYDEMVNLNLSSNTNGTIYYTIDGSIPTTDSDVFTAPITLEIGIHEVNAFFVNNYGIQSDVARAVYTIDIRIPDPPVVEPESGDYEIPVWITAEAQKYCTVYYTTDGTAPTMESNMYVNAVPMPLGHSHFIFATFSQEGVSGDLVECDYNLTVTAEINMADILNALCYYNINSGKTVDEYGHLPGSLTHYSYIINAALTLRDYENPDAPLGVHPKVYYLITENMIDSTNVSMRTGTYYMCDIETGELYKARRTEEQEFFRGELIPEELCQPPVITESSDTNAQEETQEGIEQTQENAAP